MQKLENFLKQYEKGPKIGETGNPVKNNPTMVSTFQQYTLLEKK